MTESTMRWTRDEAQVKKNACKILLEKNWNKRPFGRPGTIMLNFILGEEVVGMWCRLNWPNTRFTGKFPRSFWFHICMQFLDTLSKYEGTPCSVYCEAWGCSILNLLKIIIYEGRWKSSWTGGIAPLLCRGRRWLLCQVVVVGVT